MFAEILLGREPGGKKGGISGGEKSRPPTLDPENTTVNSRIRADWRAEERLEKLAVPFLPQSASRNAQLLDGRVSTDPGGQHLTVRTGGHAKPELATDGALVDRESISQRATQGV